MLDSATIAISDAVSAVTQHSSWMELAKLPLPMYRCISRLYLYCWLAVFLSHCTIACFLNTRAWKSCACGPGKLGRLLSVEIPSPAFTCCCFTSLGMYIATCYGRCLNSVSLPEVQFCSHLLYIIAFNSIVSKPQNMMARTPCAFTI